MTTHDDYMTKRQARDLARRLARLERRQRSTAAAHADLRHSSIDGGRGLVLKDEQGQEKYRLGTDENGVTAPQYKGGPTPEQPSEPFVDAGQRVIKVQHSGLDVHEDPAPADFKVAEVHVSQDATFEPSLSTLGNHIAVPNGSVDHSLPAGEWYVGIVWVTLSGKRSPMSEPVQAVIEPPVDAQDIQDTLDTAQARLDEYRDEVAAPRFQALEQGLSENSDNLQDARDRLTVAESTLEPLPGRITEAEQEVEQARDAAVAAEARATEANNRAMTRLANGNFENNLLYWDYHNVTLSDTAHSGQQAAQIGIGGFLMPESAIPVVRDQIWELSFYHRALEGESTVYAGAFSVDEQGEIIGDLGFHNFTSSEVWSDSGAIRVHIPEDVEMISTYIQAGIDTFLVDDVTLRDVTDVVRLEEAANANRKKAEAAEAGLALLQLAVDGEGGLKDRLSTAESTLEDKADTSRLNELDAKLSGDLAAIEAHYSRIWRQSTPPPSGVHYAWLSEPHASVSVRFDGDGNETARNLIPDPQFRGDLSGALIRGEYEVSDGWLRLETAGIVPYFGASIAVTPGEFAALRFAMRWGQGIGRFHIQFQFRNSSGGSVSNAQIAIDYSDMPHDGDMQFAHLVPNTATEVRAYVWLYEEGGWIQPEDGAHVFMSRWRFDTADSEEAALSQIETYFDGDTESDRAHDLWYNQQGVPHEWVNGTNGQAGGWVELSDDRINQLQTDVVEAAETAYLDRLVVRDEVVTPETITNRLWADLGVFNRLDAREAYVGGSHLKDGAVTAEKITATRELITKIMGAEWAYIAQQLIVDGKILTRDLEALSAAIQSLTVTQRADIAELWAEELWTALAIIEELQSKEAWITSAMISELTAEKVTVTQNFVGRVAELLHLVVDRIDANQLWADRTWQNAGYFGSEDADQQTRLDGTGLRITKHDHDNETSTDIVRLGGEGIGLTFTDAETGEVAGSLSHEGDASFRDVSVESLTHGGRPLQDEDCQDYIHPSGNQSLISWRPRAVVGRGQLDIPYIQSDYHEYGFMEISAQLHAGRSYWLIISPFMTRAFSNTTRLRIRYTNNGTTPTTESELAVNARYGADRNDFTVLGGQWLFTPETTGLHRFLVSIWKNHGTDTTIGGGTTQFTIEDAGSAVPDTTVVREAYGDHPDGNPPITGPVITNDALTTIWEATWYQNYSHSGTTQRTNHNSTSGYGASGPTQGQRVGQAPGGIWTSVFGFGGATSGDPSDLGKTIQQVLNQSAEVQTIHLEVRGGGSHNSRDTNFGFSATPYATPPNQFTLNSTATHITAERIRPSQKLRISIPVDEFTAMLKSGDFRSIGLRTGATSLNNGGWLDWKYPPRLIITHAKES